MAEADRVSGNMKDGKDCFRSNVSRHVPNDGWHSGHVARK